MRYKEVGINRLSLGVQSLDQRILDQLKRSHSVSQTFQAMDLILSEFPQSALTVDFLLSVPNQDSRNALESSQNFLETFGPGHVSAYILTMEKNTLLFKQVNELNQISLPSESEIVKDYVSFQEMMNRINYTQYEISSFHKGGLGI